LSQATAVTVPRLDPPLHERDHTRGAPGASIQLVEYGDYECPYCRLVYHNIQQLQEFLGDRLCYAYRHFPLRTVHPHAQLAAEAAEAAAAQDKFWEMHDALFEKGELDEEHLIQYAAEMGLDVEQFQHDLNEHVYAGKVREDFRSGLRSGVNGTPTFFVNGERYDGPWDLEALLERVEKPLGVRVQMLGARFARISALGGVLLLLATALAMLWANLSRQGSYVALWESHLAIQLGNLSLSESLLEWVNDGLMAIFFFVVGLEIKREILTGELAAPRRAFLPVAGAIGGMALPAAIYLLFNRGGPSEGGWGIPVSTDIAFTLGILTLLKNRVPFSLTIFFTALAIADDLGAIGVIALFYSSHIAWPNLLIAALFLLGLVVLNRGRVYATLPYAVLGVGLWLAFLHSGIHATVAGVLLALTVPHRTPPTIRGLLAQAVTVLDSFALPAEWQERFYSHRQAALQTLETITERMRSPAQRMEHGLNPWSSYVILPLFALANAGVILRAEAFQTLLSPMSLGIILGLVIGKPVGITVLSWLAVRLGWAELPSSVNWQQFVSASCLAGIGFTMALFITNAAFVDGTLRATAKLAILVASILAAVLGTLLLFATSRLSTGRTPRT